MLVKFKVFRFDPSVDLKPKYELFDVPSEKDTTVLDGLIYIKENLSKSLSFRRSCREGVCGSCAMRINKISNLACKTHVFDVMNNESVLIEPLDHLQVIKDLVVNLEPFFDGIRHIRPWRIANLNEENVEKPRKINMNEFLKTMEAKSCILCAACYSDCNVIDVDRTFIGPAALVKVARFVSDPWDSHDGRLREAIDLGLFKCPIDQECEIACPRDIDIRRGVVEWLRYQCTKEGLGPLPTHKRLVQNVLETGGVVPVQDTPAFSMFPEYIKEFEGEPQAEVVLFTGCIINRRQQDTCRAIIEIFQNNRVAVHLPKRQTCCGSPFMRTGQRDTMKPFVEQNFNLFNEFAEKGITHVVTSCSGCNSTLRFDYPQLAKEYKIPMNFEIYDIGEYMAKIIDLNTEDLKETPLKLMYHYPCHIKASGLEEEIYIDLIGKIPGLELVDSPKSGLCCGGGGGVRSAYSDLSDALAIRRIEIAKDFGVNGLVTNCPFCVMSFERVLELKKAQNEDMGFDLYDFYRLFADAYK
ncbi:MAG: succinate dehydrogenase/fumarate reductase iron-sulfur subunit [Promethearchaeota archaeon]|nr:MAG: succinate dehydrogenase/fumarate reductase iron-sulfur subunit [Candidatus Lokiarchaeota archaeon]